MAMQDEPTAGESMSAQAEGEFKQPRCCLGMLLPGQ
jgi:hypothetical protein